MRTISAPLLSYSPRLETCGCSFVSSLPPSLRSPYLSPKINGRFSRLRLRCSSNGQGFDSGKNDSKVILDAFFLGKALAETLNERVEAAVGEFLSSIGQWQAEQRKQVEDIQDEVFERAKRAKEKAALEALETQGIPSKPSAASAETETPGVQPPSPPPNDTPSPPPSVPPQSPIPPTSPQPSVPPQSPVPPTSPPDAAKD